METKKSFKADLGNKRSLFLEIGLLAALALVIAAFSYTPAEYEIKHVDLGYMPVDEGYLPVNTPEPPRQAPHRIEIKTVTDLLQIVPNDEQIKVDIDFRDFEADALVAPMVPVKEEEVVEEQIFLTVESMPKFMGGDLDAFRRWVSQNVRFPQIALDNGVHGRVVLEFVIEKDGSLTNIKVLQAPDRLLSEEAVRVLKTSPKWVPGKQRDRTVRVKYTLPVDFRVQQ